MSSAVAISTTHLGLPAPTSNYVITNEACTIVNKLITVHNIGITIQVEHKVATYAHDSNAWRFLRKICYGFPPSVVTLENDKIMLFQPRRKTIPISRHSIERCLHW